MFMVIAAMFLAVAIFDLYAGRSARTCVACGKRLKHAEDCYKKKDRP